MYYYITRFWVKQYSKAKPIKEEDVKKLRCAIDIRGEEDYNNI